MKTVNYRVEDLIFSEYNPRKISDRQLKDLSDSITRFGFVEPVIINTNEDRKNIVISGHQRLRAAEKLKIGTVPCIGLDLSPEREKELNIRMNKAGGEWDQDLLIEFFEKDNLLEWGFETEDFPFRPDNIYEDNYEVPDEIETDIKLGDIFQIGQHRLMCGDSTKEEDVGRLMGGQLSDMIFTDPPYNVDYGISKNPRHKIRKIENDKQSPEEWEIFCKAVFLNFKLFNKGDVYMWGASCPDGMQMRLWLIEAGAHWSATIVWKKQQLVLSPAKYQRMYEPCFYGWFSKSSFRADRKEVEVWEIDRPRDSKEHPTMKPIALCAKGINNSSRERDCVLDLFLGSGSTMVAAHQLNRMCYGMEIDPKYCQVVIDRMKKLDPETNIEKQHNATEKKGST